MSRSYRKPYFRYVCMKDSTVRGIKRMANRTYRHKMNQGRFDEGAPLTYHKKVEDTYWTYDLAKFYASKEDYPDSEFYQKLNRK